jgi:hypothetical protein
MKAKSLGASGCAANLTDLHDDNWRQQRLQQHSAAPGTDFATPLQSSYLLSPEMNSANQTRWHQKLIKFHCQKPLCGA